MATISQINGNEVAGKEFYDYVRTEGAVLFSFNPDFSPAARYGGSWENITDRFLIGAGGSYELNSTGGANNITLVGNNIPPHRHSISVVQNTNSPTPGRTPYVSYGTYTQSPNILQTNAFGAAEPIETIPPYIACNIWRRVA